MLGTRYIGRYKVIEEIGRGGMGIVYRGEDPRLERPVAIKVLPPRMTSGKALERFKREARVCARLDHPCILKIFDYGEEQQTCHIVMEFVEGVTLRDLIAGEPDVEAIDVAERARIFGQVCLALEYAHGLGITHRDVKPENIMVTTSTGHWDPATSRVKVMDFGLAILEGSHSLTDQGAVMGTIAYFSPEQANGETADLRSDIYSLGVMLYEMLTAELPFEATHPAEMIRRHLETPAPSPRILNPRVPASLERIVLRCMRKSPADRYPSVTELRQDLDAFRAEAGIPASYFWGGARTGAEGAPSPAASSMMRTAFDASPDPFQQPLAPLVPPAREEADDEEASGEGAPDGDASLDDADVARRLREMRQQEAARDPRPPGMPLDVSLLASPQTPGMPADVASRLGAPLPSASSSANRAPSPAQREAPPDTGTSGRPGAPLSGVAPIASREWMAQAQGGSDGAEGRYGSYMARLRRDDSATQGRAGDVPSSVICACGRENPSDRKHCSACGSLLGGSAFLPSREVEAHVELGQRHLENGHVADAIYELGHALSRDPNHAEARRLMGRAQRLAGEPVKAEEELRLALSLRPGDVEAWVELAHLLRYLGRKSEATSALQEAVRLRPSDAALRCQLAFLYAHRGKLLKAVEEYRTVLAYDERNVDARLQLGIIYGAQSFMQEAIHEFERVVQLEPESVSAWRWLGTLYARFNRLGDAEKALQAALEIAPDDADVHADLGTLYEAQRREDLAVRELRQAIALEQGHNEARHRLAQLYLRHRQPQLAIRELEELSAWHPTDSRVHQHLGELYLGQGDLNRALQHFERTVALNPASAEMHNRLGQLYFKKDYGALTLQEYQSAVSLDPYNPGYHEDLGMAYYVNGNRDLALQELKKASILDARNVDYFKAIGLLCAEEGRLEEAVQNLKRAVELAPRDAQAHGMLGRVYAQQKLLNWAVLEFQKAVEHDAENPLMHVYLARVYAELGRHDDAVGAFRKAISVLQSEGETPENRRALGRSYQDLGKTYLEAGNLQAAREMIESALVLLPSDVRGMHLMGQALAAQKSWEKALEYLSDALEREPNNPDILSDIGWVHEQTGAPEKALKALRKAVGMAPRKAVLYERLGSVLCDLGRYEEAHELVSKAMALDPRREDFYHHLQGRLHASQGQWQKAAAACQIARRVNPGVGAYALDLARALVHLGRRTDAVGELREALAHGSLPQAEVRQLQDELDRLQSIG